MITITVEYMREKKTLEMPAGSTGADLLKKYPFKGLYMTLNGRMIFDDPGQYELKDGDEVSLTRYLVSGG